MAIFTRAENSFLKDLVLGTSWAFLLFFAHRLIIKINENDDDIQEIFARLEECEKVELKK